MVSLLLSSLEFKKNAAANYHIKDGNLVLKIIEKQKPWCPKLCGDLKCSSFQTGIFAGKLGSSQGQSRFSPECTVTEEQAPLRLYTPQYGYFEVRLKANITKDDMVAFWMIGYEDKPERSGEICVMEIFGNEIHGDTLINGSGIHPFGDNNLKDEFYKDKLKMDIKDFHTFSVEWQMDKVKFFIDNKLTRTINQSPKYPMQFMIDIYEFPSTEKTRAVSYPKELIVDYVRGYSLKK